MAFLSDPRVTAALNKTMETKVQAITQPIFTKLKDHTRLIDELKNEMLDNKLCESSQHLDNLEQQMAEMCGTRRRGHKQHRHLTW